MLGSALYFPDIDIRDPAWLRSAVLFWDEIQTIAPSEIEVPYQQEDTRICHAEGYLQPLRCDLHPRVLDDLGHKIWQLGDRRSGNFWRHANASNPVFQSVREADELARELEVAYEEKLIHPNKMSKETREIGLQLGLMRRLIGGGQSSVPQNEDRLLVDGRFADAYMSALAAHLSHQLSLSPLTSQSLAHGMSFRFMFDEAIDMRPENATGTMVGVVMRGLRVDPSVPVTKLLKFREKRKDQYLDLAAKITELSEQLEGKGEADGEELFNRARKAYDKDIEPSLRALKRELNQQSISTVWAGAYRAITISVPSAGALAYFTGLTGPALLGAGAALAAADIGVRGYLAGQKSRSSNPFSYLHDINANFGLPDFGEA